MLQGLRNTRFVVWIAVAGLLLGSMVATPAAAYDGGAPETVTRTIVAGITVTPRGDDLEIGLGEQRETVAPSGVTTVARLVPAPMKNEEDGLKTCVTKRDTASNPNFTAFAPVPVEAESGAGHVQFIFSLFRLEKARRVNYNGPEKSRQFEVCSRGLGQADIDRYKMVWVGGAQAEIEQPRTTKIGWTYKTGKTPPSFTLSYGFALGSKMCDSKACVDASVSAHLEQNVSAALRGGFKAPDHLINNSYWKNNVAGWWDGRDVGGVRSFISQGNVAHGLWEHPESDAYGVEPTFNYEVYAKFECTRWFGFGCSLPTGQQPHV